MKRLLNRLILSFVIFFMLMGLVPVDVYADAYKGNIPQSDVVVLNPDFGSFSYSNSPLAQYKGESGVTIRSYSNAYLSQDNLKKVYDELMKNGHGEEISYLSYVDLIGDYPYGTGTAGKWYGQWDNGVLDKGRYIELYGCNSRSFTELARTLSHEYGHHFTYYYLNKGEHIDNSSIMESSFAKIRGLSSYSNINDGDHMWSPPEIAAEDYVQLFGSPTGKGSMKFEDVRDQVINGTIGPRSYSTLVYNLAPQENEDIPLAWQVPGLYQYWSGLSGVKAVNTVPPTVPFLALMSADNGTFKFNWTQSTDDTKNIEYTLVAYNNQTDDLYGIRTTTDTAGRDAVVGTYSTDTIIAKDNVLGSKMFFRVYAKDGDGNIVSSNDLPVDPANPSASIGLLPNRISGQDRYETSVKISIAGWPRNSDTAVLVTGDDFPDALSAAPLAKLNNAPILLTRPDKLESSVEKELDRLSVKKVIIVGGPGAVSPAIEENIRAKGIVCSRIAGNDRYETAVGVAKAIMNMKAFNKAVLATGDNFPDALSIASYAASMGYPILLTDGKNLSDSALKILSDKGLQQVYVVGGSGVIDNSLLPKVSNAVRLSGSDRYGTNLAVIDGLKKDFDMSSIYIATGDNFPDALAGSVLAGMKRAPIFLIDRDSEGAVEKYLSPIQGAVKSINVLGGEGVVNSDIIMNLMLKN